MTISQARIDAAMRNTPSFSNLEPQDVHDIIEAADNEPEHKAALDCLLDFAHANSDEIDDPEITAAIKTLRGET